MNSPSMFIPSKNDMLWGNLLHKYLWDVINWELFIHRIEKDKSSSIEVLARRKVIKELLPCPITFYDYAGFYIFQYELGKGKYSFNETDLSPPKLVIDFISEVGPNTVFCETFDRSTLTLWTVLSNNGSSEISYNYSMLNNAVEDVTSQKTQFLYNLRTTDLDRIGYRHFTLKEPRGMPDPRITAVSRMKDYSFSKLQAKDLTYDMEIHTKLIVHCPLNIEQILHRARLLYINGFFEWEFLTVAEHYACLALEASLRSLYDDWLGTQNVEVEAEIRGKQVAVIMKPERDEIYNWSNKKGAQNVKVKGMLFPRNKESLLEHAVKINCLTKWDQSKCRSLFKLRDIHSHPDSLQINWINHVRAIIEEVCVYINLMWGRNARCISKLNLYDKDE